MMMLDVLLRPRYIAEKTDVMLDVLLRPRYIAEKI